MRQGWPFETTIRAPVGADRQGLPLGAGVSLSLGELGPCHNRYLMPQATARLGMSVNPVLLVLLCC